MNETERKMYSVICRHEGIKAKDIAREIGQGRKDINKILYGIPFIRELCYQDRAFRWHGMIRQTRPHRGLADFCGYYGRGLVGRGPSRDCRPGGGYYVLLTSKWMLAQTCDCIGRAE